MFQVKGALVLVACVCLSRISAVSARIYHSARDSAASRFPSRRGGPSFDDFSREFAKDVTTTPFERFSNGFQNDVDWKRTHRRTGFIRPLRNHRKVVLWDGNSESLRKVDTTVPKRGVYSAWQRRHSRLSMDVQAKKATGGAQLVMFGDSHMEAFMGTANPSILSPSILQKEYAVFQEVMQTTRNLETVFGVPAQVQGIAGDTTQGLLYRLEHGEMDSDPPKVATLLVGTSDLALGVHPSSIAMGVEANVEKLLAWGPDVQVILLALFPRVDDVCGKNKTTKCPLEVDMKLSYYTRPVEEVNDQLEQVASKHPRVTFVNCNSRFTLRKGTAMYLNTKIFKDGMHILDFDGANSFLECIKDPVKERLAS
uniref:SGNH hydrolase-type esterase domain-containing protein n=1 Tax=Pyramimonas obovata TaxID=1411642 RepID=A0A7S0QSB6_9CHLO|mmetsp:Transcript_18014/g.39344  ORF Transcript_18014/g.39344 Transcript_18014/m.39344 type:complete len:368 (+) Transcript_18014:161-1264(+)